MATTEQYAQWIVDNQNQKGSDNFNKVAEAYKLSKTQSASVEAPQGEEGFIDSALDSAGDFVGGAVRGAGSIGATILAPLDMAKDAIDGKGLSLESNRARRAAMDSGLEQLGVDTGSIAFGAGKLGGEIAGTAGIPLAAGAKVATVAPKLGSAIKTGGFSLGSQGGGKATNALLRVSGGAASGGLMAGAVNPEDATTGAMIGGAFPASAQVLGATGGAIGKGARKVVGEVSDEVRALANRAEELGIKIPVDRLTDSKALNATAESLNYVPFSGRGAVEDTLSASLNKALSKTFGQNTDNITKGLRNASEELGGQFDAVLKNNKLKIDNQFIDDIADVEAQAVAELGSDALRPIKNQIDELMNKVGADEFVDGQAAYNIKKTLDRLGRGRGNEAFHALELKKKLMDALNRSLTPEQAQNFATVRKQYGNMLSLQKLAKNGAEGDISVARLANLKNINNPELQEIADIAAQFVKKRESQHGAAQRVVAGGAAAILGGPAALATTVVGSRGVNKLLNSGAARKSVLGNTQSKIGENLNRLLEPAARVAPVISAQ